MSSSVSPRVSVPRNTDRAPLCLQVLLVDVLGGKAVFVQSRHGPVLDLGHAKPTAHLFVAREELTAFETVEAMQYVSTAGTVTVGRSEGAGPPPWVCVHRGGPHLTHLAHVHV